MKKMKLDDEEQDLVDSFERGEWRSVPNFEQEKKKYQEIAAATFRKDRRVNIRISSKDLIEHNFAVVQFIVVEVDKQCAII